MGSLHLSEHDYEDYKRDYNRLLASGKLFEEYPDFTGCWLKDLRDFIGPQEEAKQPPETPNIIKENDPPVKWE